MLLGTIPFLFEGGLIMADGQELDNLLINIDSQLGDLKGIDTAISALERLSRITQDASKGVKQLGTLGTVMHNFNGLKLDGLEEASRGVNNLVSALGDLSKVGNVSKRTFTQFGKLGETLKTSFGGLGTALKGLEDVSYGVYNMARALEALSKISGSAKGSISQLGNLGDSMHKFEGISKDIDSLVEPIKKLMEAIGNVGNNNTISIRVDQGGIAKVNQIQRATKKAMSSWNEFYNALQSDKGNLNLGDLFDLSKPVDELEKNLSRAQRSLGTFENNARANLDKINGALSNFSMQDLKDNLTFRNAVRGNQMSEAYANAYRTGIEQLKGQIESIRTQEIDNAWNHTLQSIRDNLDRFDLSELIRTDLPLDQMRANLRRMENELSRAQSSMERARTNMQRLMADEPDITKLQADKGYRDSYYTWETNREYVLRYRDAINQLGTAIRAIPDIPQTDLGALRELPNLRQQIERYSRAYTELRTSDNTEQNSRAMSYFEEGLEYLTSRLENIQNTLEDIPRTAEGTVEFMRQWADEAERTARATAETESNMRNSVGQGFGQFGSMLSGTHNQFLGSLGNLSSMFGNAVSSGTANLSTEALSGLQGISQTLGTVATAVSQVTGLVGVFVSLFKTVWNVLDGAREKMLSFVQSMVQFSKNMLSHVVGAFNAVSGAVSKVVSAVRSGAETITVALRKIGDATKTIISFLGNIGSAIAPAIKGLKGLFGFVTPKIAKNLSSADLSLKNIIKNTRLLNKALQITGKWLTMLSRMLMRKIVQAFISGVKQAFDDLVLFEKNAGDGLLRLNENVSLIFSGLRRVANQIIAIFEPLINAVSAPLESFLDRMSYIGEQMAKFMAILTGQPYYIRAKKFYEDYGQNVEDTNKKVKNLTNGLDELNILNDTSSSSSDQVTPEDMFEKVPVGELELPNLLEEIKKWLKNIDWDKIKQKVRDFIHKLMDIVNDILKDLELWGLIGDTIAQLFNTLMEAWNQFITDFDPVATEKALSELIVRALNGIDWDLIHENVELTAKKFAQFWNEVFADDRLWDAITTTITNLLNEIVHYFDTWAWTFDFSGMARQLTRSLTNILEGFDYEQLRHAVEGWAKGIVDFINTTASDKRFWSTLGESIAKAINATIVEAIGDLSGINFTDLTDSLKTAIEDALNNIEWEDFKKDLSTWGSNLADIINGIFADKDFLSTITTSIAKFSNAITGGLDRFLEDIRGYDIGTSISNALQKGLSEIDWETVFTLPSSAINVLSSAISGLLDAVPEDFNLGTWLADHLKLTMEDIDWDRIESDVDKFTTQVTNFINGLLADSKFWDDVFTTITKTFDIVVDLILNPLVNVNAENLGARIAQAVNKVLEGNRIRNLIANVGKVIMNLIITVDVALKGIEWGEMGKQIADGIADAIDTLFKNKKKIRQTIFNAFKSFSTLVESALREMLSRKTFAKLGQILGEIGLGIINGMATFFSQNTDEIIAGMKQFGESLASFITLHEDEIVNGLNTVIDSICDIIDAFFGEKGTLYNAINSVIERLHLGRLIGTIISNAIRAFTAKLKNLDAIMTAIQGDLDGLAYALWQGLKGLLKYLGKKILEYAVSDLWKGASKPLFDFGELILGFFGISDGKFDISKIFDGLSFTGIGNAWNKLTEKISGVGDWFKEKLGNVGDFFSGLFGGKKDQEVEVPVSFKPSVDQAEGWDDLFDETKSIPIELEDPTLGTITASLIDVDTISANILNVDDIYALRLHVDDIISSSSSKSGSYSMSTNLAGNSIGAESGTLTNGTVRTETTGQKIANWLSKFKSSSGTKWSDISGVASASDLLSGIKSSVLPSTKTNTTIKTGTINTDKISTGKTGTSTALGTSLKDAYSSNELYALLKGVDLNKLLKSINWNKLLKSIDFNKLLKNVDLNKLLKNVNLNTLFEKVKWADYAKLFAEEVFKHFKAMLDDLDWTKYGEQIGDGILSKLENKDKKDGSYSMAENQAGLDLGGESGVLSSNEDENILDKLLDLFPDGFLSKEDVDLIDIRLGNVYLDLKDFFDDVNALFKEWNFAEKFFSKRDKEQLAHDLKALRMNIQDFLDDVYNDILAFKEKVEKLFDNMKTAFLEGFGDKAKEEMSKALEVIKTYTGLMILEFVRLKLAFADIFNGIEAKMDEVFKSILEKLDTYLAQIKEKIENFNLSVNLLAGLADNVNLQMASVYDVIDTWLGKIALLLSSFNAPLTLNVAQAFSNELNNAYGYVDDFVNRVQSRFNSLNLNSLINNQLGDVQIRCDVECHGDCSCCKNGSNSTTGNSGTKTVTTRGGSSSGDTTDNSRDTVKGGSSGGSSTDNTRDTVKGGSSGGTTKNTGSESLDKNDQTVNISDITSGSVGSNDGGGKDTRNTSNNSTDNTNNQNDNNSNGTNNNNNQNDNGNNGTNNNTINDNNTNNDNNDSNGDNSNENTPDNVQEEKDKKEYSTDNRLKTIQKNQEQLLGNATENVESAKGILDSILNDKDATATQKADAQKYYDEAVRQKTLRENTYNEVMNAQNYEEGTKVLDKYKSQGLTTSGTKTQLGLLQTLSKNIETTKKQKAEAEKALEKIKANGTDDQITKANKAFANGNYSEVIKIGNEVVEKSAYQDLSKLFVGVDGGIKSWNSLTDLQKSALLNGIFNVNLFYHSNGKAGVFTTKDQLTGSPLTSTVAWLKTQTSDKYKGVDSNTLTDGTYNYKFSNGIFKGKEPVKSTATTSQGSSSAGQISADSKTAIDGRSDPTNTSDNIQASVPNYIDANGKKQPIVITYGSNTNKTSALAEKTKRTYENGFGIGYFQVGGYDGKYLKDPKASFDYWYENSFLVKGYEMGGLPKSGELYLARENGQNEFIGSLGNQSVVANNDQIITAVANGVSMANDRVVSAIENQTSNLENAIDRKDVNVTIGDRQIAEANRRGTQSMGNKFVE